MMTISGRHISNAMVERRRKKRCRACQVDGVTRRRARRAVHV